VFSYKVFCYSQPTNHSVDTEDRYAASGHSTAELKQNNLLMGSELSLFPAGDFPAV
jgi:hypothetical protein